MVNGLPWCTASWYSLSSLNLRVGVIDVPFHTQWKSVVGVIITAGKIDDTPWRKKSSIVDIMIWLCSDLTHDPMSENHFNLKQLGLYTCHKELYVSTFSNILSQSFTYYESPLKMTVCICSKILWIVIIYEDVLVIFPWRFNERIVHIFNDILGRVVVPTYFQISSRAIKIFSNTMSEWFVVWRYK